MNTKLRQQLRRGRERGAVAVIVAVSMVALMAAAALGFDIAKLVYEKQQLQNALDAAAAAGAQQLPDNPTQAVKDAEAFAAANMVGANLGSITPTVALRCVVAYNNITNSPDWTTVLALCGISSKVWDPLTCNDYICSVPCTTANRCNTIVVSYNKTVQYSFGPAIGIDTGQTGTVVSAACRGICGKAIPNPLDVVVVADRTPSMADSEITAMKSGIKSMLETMNRDQQYVAFSTIAISQNRNGCAANEPSGGQAFTNATYKEAGKSWSWSNKLWSFGGSWVPVPFSNNYTTGLETISLNTSSQLVSAINCMPKSDDTVKYPAASDGLENQTNEGTHLASALKGAARYLLGKDPNNLTSLPDRSDYGTPRKVIIFETDGAPSELFNSADAALTLNNSHDIGYTGGNDVGNGLAKSCQNFRSIATQAKAEGILIITIGYGDVNSASCGSEGYVRDVLAKVASPKQDGTASTASNCSTTSVKKAENTDGDNYFCGASADDLKGIFLTAMGQINGHGRLMSLPGIN